jgi:hypothetical protein
MRVLLLLLVACGEAGVLEVADRAAGDIDGEPSWRDVEIPEDCEGRQRDNAMLFVVCDGHATWSKAVEKCEALGMELAWFDVAEDNAMARELVGEAKSVPIQDPAVWIGATDAEREGTWRWSDGTPAGSQFWELDEPGGATAENCAAMSVLTGAWSDEDCNVPRQYVCRA